MLSADLADVDDRALVRVLDRDPRAVEEFYRRHVRWLTRSVSRTVPDPHDCADVVTATFIAAMESGDRYDPDRGDARAWLYGIARNVMSTRWRRAAAESRAVQRLTARLAVSAGDDFDRADDRLDARALAGPAVAAVAALPPSERAIIELMLWRELSIGEAAAQLGIRPGTARMRLARARRRLASALPAATTGTDPGREEAP